MKHSCLILLAMSLVFLGTNVRESGAGIVHVDSFTHFQGGLFFDFEVHNDLDLLSDYMTDRSASANLGSFVALNAGTLSDPGNGRGLMVLSAFGAAPSILIINFNAPLQGVGATFYHMPNMGFSNPATIEIYDSPDATGNLIGSITDTGLADDVQHSPQDFVGLICDEPIIKSVLFTGTGSRPSFAIDGIAILTSNPEPVPLPSAATLFASALMFFACLRKFTKS